MVFARSALFNLALVALSLTSVTAGPLQSGDALVERDPQAFVPRFSCTCVNGAKRQMSGPICSGAGGVIDGNACKGLVTKLVTQDCQALIDPKSHVECKQLP